MRPCLDDEKRQPENTEPSSPWFDDDEPLPRPDPERLRTSTASLRVSLDRLERHLAS
jgi:hypothetical protein